MLRTKLAGHALAPLLLGARPLECLLKILDTNVRPPKAIASGIQWTRAELSDKVGAGFHQAI